MISYVSWDFVLFFQFFIIFFYFPLQKSFKLYDVIVFFLFFFPLFSVFITAHYIT